MEKKFYTGLWAVFFALVLPGFAIAQSCTGGPSAEEIDMYLACYNSPLEGEGSTFWEAGKANDVDPRLLVALAGAESSFGKAICTPHNAWNWSYSGVCKSPFDSWGAGIWTVAEGVRRIYLDGGKNTIRTMSDGRRPSYCGKGCGFWIPNVTRFFADQGGDPESNNLGFPHEYDLDLYATNQMLQQQRSVEQRTSDVPPLYTPPPAYIPLPERPSAPAGSIDPDGRIRVTWQDRSENEVGFRVYRRGADIPLQWEVIASLQENVNSFLDGTITCGEAYYYGVAAFNESGESEHAGWRVVLAPTCN